MTEIVLLAIAGKVLIFLAQKFAQNLNLQIPFLKKLFECSLCLGVWVYGFLSAVTGITLFSDLFYSPLSSELITAGLLSFTVFLISLGWNEYFGKVYIVE